MTIEPGKIVPSPGIRFLTALRRWVRVWWLSILAALALTAVGIFPTLFSVVAFLGLVWLPIVALTLWGRMLDETMHPRSDVEDGCR